MNRTRAVTWRRTWRRALTAAAFILALAAGARADDKLTAMFTDEQSTLPVCCRDKIAIPSEIIVVRFTRTGCEVSAEQAPLVCALEAEFAADSALFLTFDFSTTSTALQSSYLSHALGLEDLWSRFAGQSGFLAVASASDRKFLVKITKDHDLPAMRRELRARLRSARPE